MHAEVPSWQRAVVTVGFVACLPLVPAAWLVYILTGSRSDLYGAGLVLVVEFSGAVWLCALVPLSALSLINWERWPTGLHALALSPLIALLGFAACYLMVMVIALVS